MILTTVVPQIRHRTKLPFHQAERLNSQMKWAICEGNIPVSGSIGRHAMILDPLAFALENLVEAETDFALAMSADKDGQPWASTNRLCQSCKKLFTARPVEISGPIHPGGPVPAFLCVECGEDQAPALAALLHRHYKTEPARRPEPPAPPPPPTDEERGYAMLAQALGDERRAEQLVESLKLIFGFGETETNDLELLGE